MLPSFNLPHGGRGRGGFPHGFPGGGGNNNNNNNNNKASKQKQPKPVAPAPKFSNQTRIFDVLHSDHSSPVASVRFSNKGQFCAAASQKEIVIYDTTTSNYNNNNNNMQNQQQQQQPNWTLLAKIPIAGSSFPQIPLAFNNDDTRLCTLQPNSSSLCLLNTQTWKQQGSQTFQVSSGIVSDCAFDPRGKKLTTVGGNSIQVWNTSNKSVRAEIGSAHQVLCCAYNSSGTRLVCAGSGSGEAKQILILDTEDSYQCLRRLEHFVNSTVVSVGFSSDGKSFFSAGVDGVAVIWNAETLSKTTYACTQPVPDNFLIQNSGGGGNFALQQDDASSLSSQHQSQEQQQNQQQDEEEEGKKLVNSAASAATAGNNNNNNQNQNQLPVSPAAPKQPMIDAQINGDTRTIACLFGNKIRFCSATSGKDILPPCEEISSSLVGSSSTASASASSSSSSSDFVFNCFAMSPRLDKFAVGHRDGVVVIENLLVGEVKWKTRKILFAIQKFGKGHLAVGFETWHVMEMAAVFLNWLEL